jgi:hypothetical protein
VVLNSAAPRGPEDSECVGLIDHEQTVVRGGDLPQPIKGSNLPERRVQAVGHDQGSLTGCQVVPELMLQVLGIQMAKRPMTQVGSTNTISQSKVS